MAKFYKNFGIEMQCFFLIVFHKKNYENQKWNIMNISNAFLINILYGLTYKFLIAFHFFNSQISIIFKMFSQELKEHEIHNPFPEKIHIYNCHHVFFTYFVHIMSLVYSGVNL